MSDNQNNSGSPDAAGEAKKGGKKVLIIGIIGVLLMAAGAGFYFWRASATSAAEAPAKKKGGKKAQAEEPSEGETAEAKEGDHKGGESKLKDSLPNDEDVKEVVELPPFIVNLADTEQARYLRMTVSLGVGGAEEKSEKPDNLFMTRVRNAMLTVLSDKKSEDILSVEGKSKLRKELLQAAQAASEEPEVHAIYITDFIVQL